MILGRWPMISVDQARELAIPILRSCRAGEMPAPAVRAEIPTLRDLLPAYAKAKSLKASSLKRYQSMCKTHFSDWLDQPATNFKSSAFAEHCHNFAQSNGAAVVEVGRGLVGALVKYINAVHGLDILNPFLKLGQAGLLPDRAKPRLRKLQTTDLPIWREAIEKLAEIQRDYLIFIAMTGLRRNECAEISVDAIDFNKGVLLIPETKNGKPHTLPITPAMKAILERRSTGQNSGCLIFKGISAEHVSEMAVRAGAPKFMLHDLRKLFATTGEKLGIGETVLRRLLNHSCKRSDTLYRHYISLSTDDVRAPLLAIQDELSRLMVVKQRP